MTNAANYILRKWKQKHFYIPLWSEAWSGEVNVFPRQSDA